MTRKPKERALTLRPHEVRAVLAGATQHWVPVRPQPERPFYCFPRPSVALFATEDEAICCEGDEVRAPLAVGDRAWVRETWQMFDPHPDGDRAALGAERLAKGRRAPWVGVVNDRPIEWTTAYRADGDLEHHEHGPARWRSAATMPRWASRILLEVTAIRVVRIQDVTNEDAVAMGARRFDDIPIGKYGGHARWSMFEPADTGQCLGTAYWAVANAWNKVHGPDAWDRNDWCWARTFRRVEAS